jgi:hypothetical protein
LLGYTLPYLLNSGGVSNEGASHLKSLRWDVTNGCLDIVRDPLYEVRRVLVHNVKHLLVNFLGGHASTEHASTCEVTSVTRVSGAHHVLGIERLLG